MLKDLCSFVDVRSTFGYVRTKWVGYSKTIFCDCWSGFSDFSAHIRPFLQRGRKDDKTMQESYTVICLWSLSAYPAPPLPMHLVLISHQDRTEPSKGSMPTRDPSFHQQWTSGMVCLPYQHKLWKTSNSFSPYQCRYTKIVIVNNML